MTVNDLNQALRGFFYSETLNSFSFSPAPIIFAPNISVRAPVRLKRLVVTSRGV